MEYKNEVIFCIVNDGYSEAVMTAAKRSGARGGTILSARGTANKVAEKHFHISIQPEKEVVMILVPTEIKDEILHSIYREVGLDTPGQGIAFALPVADVVGIGKPSLTEAEMKREEAPAENSAKEAEENAAE